MTYIASVLAREGVAVIADSLVTSMHRVIRQEDLIEFLKSKNSKDQSGPVFSAEEIMGLCKTKPSHTKDYENKLFKYDNYTAITTSGMAWLDGMKIEQIIKEKVKKNKIDKGYKNKKIETKVIELCDFLTEKIKEHIEQQGSVDTVIFILTHYNKTKNITSIYRLHVFASIKDDLLDQSHKFIEYTKAENYEKVVCDGQNRISESILLGELPITYDLIPKICNKVLNDFKISNVPKNYLDELRNNDDIVTSNLIDGVNLFKLSELSLQQAVDLACLLMNVEIDFQKYTKDIPTVGGVVKLAVIDENGFRFIAGNEITKPINI